MKRKVPDSGLALNSLHRKKHQTDWQSYPLRLSGGDGSLGDAIRHHAPERARHFFLFLAQLDMTCYEHNRTTSGTPVDPASAIRLAASHQTDRGFRESRAVYTDWKKPTKSGAIITATTSQIADPVSSFREQDAAHFANVGIAPAALAAFNGAGSSAETKALARELANIHGNTRLMPHTYNITADAVVDEVHFEVAKRFIAAARLATPSQTLFLDDGGTRHGKAWEPFVTHSNIRIYRDRVGDALKAARDDYAKEGSSTEADCCDVYERTVRDPDFETNMFQTLQANVNGEAIQYVQATGASAGPGGPAGLFYAMT